MDTYVCSRCDWYGDSTEVNINTYDSISCPVCNNAVNESNFSVNSIATFSNGCFTMKSKCKSNPSSYIKDLTELFR